MSKQLDDVLRELRDIKRELAEIKKGTVMIPHPYPVPYAVPQPYPVPVAPWAPWVAPFPYPPHPGWRLTPHVYPHPVPYWGVLTQTPVDPNGPTFTWTVGNSAGDPVTAFVGNNDTMAMVRS